MCRRIYGVNVLLCVVLQSITVYICVTACVLVCVTVCIIVLQCVYLCVCYSVCYSVHCHLFPDVQFEVLHMNVLTQAL